MKPWEKFLRAELANDGAKIERMNLEWREFGANVARARMDKSIQSISAHWELHVHKESALVTQRVGDITVEIPVEKVIGRELVETVRVTSNPLDRNSLSEINAYWAATRALRFTTDLTITAIQRDYLQRVLIDAEYGKVICGLVNTRTGATAIYIRQDSTHTVLYEDGALIRSRGAPEFSAGTWYYNPRVKRNWKPEPEKKFGKLNANGSFSLQSM